MITLTVASPVTLTVVRTMSNILSTPRIMAIPSLGTPTDSKIITNITIPAPGTAAVPTEARTVVRTIVICALNPMTY